MQKTKAYMEGYEAFHNLESLNDCPYCVMSQEYQDWISGWFDAAY